MANNAAAGTAATSNSHLATKKSCDLCVSRKRKCDGTSPCSFCVSRGHECHYSQRRPNRPRGYAKRLATEGAAGGHASSWIGREGGGEEKESSAMQMQTQMQMQHRQQETPTIGWKRVRLSASPATGLVGTEENFFLGWFFDCLGFLPLTDERLVRGAIMEVFLGLSPDSNTESVATNKAKVEQRQRSESPTPSAAKAAKEEPGLEAEAGVGSSRGEGQERQRGSDAASACTLWCTVAIGALVQGQPPERVTPYMRLAWMSLSQCFDAATAETARAFMMMAYLYNFLRNDQKFYRYLLFARGVVNRLPDNTPQKQEIVDLLARGNDTRIFHTSALEPGELDAYCKDDNPKLQVPDVVSKSALCRLLLEADRRMIKAYLRDHKAHVAPPSPLGKGLRDGDDRQASSSGERERQRPTASRLGVAGSGQGRRTGAGRRRGRGDEVGGKSAKGGGDDDDDVAEISAKTKKLSMSRNTMDEEEDPTCPGEQTSACTEEAREVFARLQETAKIPEIGAGVGGLIYNAIFGYLDLVTGGSKLTIGFFENFKQCAKVFVRYPGLCRFSTWLHLSHCMLSILAELEDTGPFEELREAYNKVRGKNALEAPAHEEWTMVGFCDHIFCRSIDDMNMTEGCTATMKHDSDSDAGTTGDTGDTGDACRPDWCCPRKDQDRPGAYEEDIHSTDHTHLPCSQPATAVPDQMLVPPKTEWSDEALETSDIPTLQRLDLAPMAGLSGVGPIDTCQSVLSIAGLTGMKGRPGGTSSSGSTSPSTLDNSQTKCGRSPPVAANSLTLECYSTGAPIPSLSGLASQQQLRVAETPTQVTSADATTRSTFGEKLAYWGDRRDGTAATVAGGDAGGEGKASV